MFRACIAGHSLNPDQGNRAGPTLHGLFGRHIATLPGDNFSAAPRQLSPAIVRNSGASCVQPTVTGMAAIASERKQLGLARLEFCCQEKASEGPWGVGADHPEDVG
jgi:hypothetical protein